MRIGYNTNGLAFHRWEDGLALLAEIGYRSVALTIDHACLNPFSPDLDRETSRMRSLLEQYEMRSVIETGARFLLDPRVKHEPTLMSPTRGEQDRRIDFLNRCIDIAARLGSDAVSFWSGTLREPLSEEAAGQRLAEGCRRVIDHADARNVQLAFESEPGMFVDRFDRFAQLLELVDAPHFGLTIDIGHVHCVEADAIPTCLRAWASRLFNVHIEDMCRGVHEHLRFGEGEIDFLPVLKCLREIGYTGGVHVELSRHSHMAPVVARESFAFLQGLIERLDDE